MNNRSIIFSITLVIGFKLSMDVKAGAISKTSDSVTLKLHNGSHIKIYEGQNFEFKFVLINNSRSHRDFPYDNVWTERIVDSKGKSIKCRYDYKDKFSINDETYFDKSMRLSVNAGDSATFYLRPDFMQFYGNSNILDYITIPDSLKRTLDLNKLPQFLRPGKYTITARFYLMIPCGNYIDMEVPLEVMPVQGIMKEQQSQFMNAIWKAIYNMIVYDPKKHWTVLTAAENPFFAVLKKDSTTIYASDLVSFLFPGSGFRPFGEEGLSYHLGVFEAVSRQTRVFEGSERVLRTFYYLYGDLIRYQGFKKYGPFDYGGIQDYLALMKKKRYPKEIIALFIDRMTINAKLEIQSLERAKKELMVPQK